MSTSKFEPVKILLVEDNEGDAVLVRQAFSKAKVRNDITTARDGQEAMDILQAAKKKRGDLPHLVLLDLNLPKKSGQEVLTELKQDTVLQAIPVVIMTSSEDEQDILKSYNMHANAYVTKPLDFSELLKIVAIIEDFWLTVVKLPRIGSS